MTPLEESHILADTAKLVAEQQKLYQEAHKFNQEALKMEKERWWYVPMLFLGNASIAALVGIIVAHIWK